MEKRAYRRCKRELPIVCRYFNSQDIDGTYSAMVLNFCKQGIYVESATCFQKGAALLVRKNGNGSTPPGKAEPGGLRTPTLTEVRWSKPVKDASGAILYYGAGLNYSPAMVDHLSAEPKNGGGHRDRLKALIVKLADPSVQRRGIIARASRTCKICGDLAIAFHSELAKFEYKVSGICQDCQDHYLS